tara:strand:+ start:3335 stop:3520 length:186 start_codon:yes stop_codon:yes gene_type:complete
MQEIKKVGMISKSDLLQHEILKKQKAKIEALEKTILVLEEELKKHREMESKMSFMLRNKLK